MYVVNYLIREKNIDPPNQNFVVFATNSSSIAQNLPDKNSEHLKVVHTRLSLGYKQFFPSGKLDFKNLLLLNQILFAVS